MVTTALISAVNLFTSVLLARHAGPTVLGEFVVLMAWAHSAFALLSPGFDQAYIRDPHQPGRWTAVSLLTAGQVLAILVLPMAFLALANMLWPDWVGGIAVVPLALVLVSIGLTVVANLLLAPLAASLSYQRINRVRLATSAAASLASLSFAFMEPVPTLWPFLARELTMGGLALLLALPAAGVRPAWDRPPSGEFRNLLGFSRDLWGLNMLEKLVQRGEYLVLAWVVPRSEVGVYYAVRSLFDGVHGMLMVPVQTVLFAFMSRGQAVAPVVTLLKPSWRLAQATLLVVAGALAMGLMAPLFPHIFGARYQTPAALPIAFFLIVVLLSYFELVKVTLMSRGRHRDLLKGRVVQLGLLLLSMPLLGGMAGLSGTAFAAVLAALALCAVAWFVMARQVELS